MSTRLIEIRKWLLEHGLTQADIARRAQVSRVSVHYFLKGFHQSSRIAAVFRALGCPEEILDRKVA